MSRLAFPFRMDASGRSAMVVEGSDPHLRQMLEQLVMTLTSERVMRPDFGSPVRQMLFRAGNDPVAVALEASLQAAIRQWLGHVLVLEDLSASFDEDEAVLDIRIEYSAVNRQSAGELTIRRGLD